MNGNHTNSFNLPPVTQAASRSAGRRQREFVAVIVALLTCVPGHAPADPGANGVRQHESVLPSELTQDMIAVIRTDFGDIVIELSQEAPLTVAGFKKYVSDGVYRQSFFHHADDRIVMGGKPGASENEGYPKSGNFNHEAAPPQEPGFPHLKGAVCMGRTVGSCNPTKNSNSTQFAIYVQDLPESTGEFTVFGRVTKGMDVVDRIREAIVNGKGPVKMEVVINTGAGTERG